MLLGKERIVGFNGRLLGSDFDIRLEVSNRCVRRQCRLDSRRVGLTAIGQDVERVDALPRRALAPETLERGVRATTGPPDRNFEQQDDEQDRVETPAPPRGSACS